jgi:hypothetical protein
MKACCVLPNITEVVKVEGAREARSSTRTRPQGLALRGTRDPKGASHKTRPKDRVKALGGGPSLPVS